jgi:amidase
MPAPVKVAFTTNPTGHGGSPAVAEGVKKAAEVLVNAGYVIEEVDPPSVEDRGDQNLS